MDNAVTGKPRTTRNQDYAFRRGHTSDKPQAIHTKQDYDLSNGQNNGKARRASEVRGDSVDRRRRSGRAQASDTT